MMLPPRPALYICRSAARVVRNAPSRWMARSCFHLELIERRHNLNAGIGNKDIEPAEGLDRFGDAGLSLSFIGNIDGDTDCTLGTAELGRNCIGVAVDVTN